MNLVSSSRYLFFWQDESFTPPQRMKSVYSNSSQQDESKLFIALCKYCTCTHTSFSFLKSSSHTESMDFTDSLSPSVLIIHHSWRVLQTTSSVHTVDFNKFLLVSQHCCVEVRRRMSLLSLSLLLQQFPTWLLHLNGSFMRWEASGCIAAIFFQDFYKTAWSILV